LTFTQQDIKMSLRVWCQSNKLICGERSEAAGIPNHIPTSGGINRNGWLLPEQSNINVKSSRCSISGAFDIYSQNHHAASRYLLWYHGIAIGGGCIGNSLPDASCVSIRLIAA
jgi:hypothetical protein